MEFTKDELELIKKSLDTFRAVLPIFKNEYDSKEYDMAYDLIMRIAKKQIE